MLRHVGAEEIGIGEVMQRTVEREEQDRERPAKLTMLPARALRPPTHIEPAEDGEPDHHARMKIPSVPLGMFMFNVQCSLIVDH
jgi:hypothetical protein